MTGKSRNRRRLQLAISAMAAFLLVLAAAAAAGALLLDNGGDSSAGPDTNDRKGTPETTATTAPGSETTTAPVTKTAASPVEAAALKAALGQFNATDDAVACKMSPPRPQNCLFHDVTEKDSPERGIAVFGLGFRDGGGALIVFGRDEAGGWQFWFGTQQSVYHALALPAQMRICADGSAANVRMAPDMSAKSLGTLKEGTLVTAEQFVLTQPGAYSADSATGGMGWYQVSGELTGFIRADLLSVATLPDCSVRDALVKTV